MSPDLQSKPRKHAYFWRACRYLGPYRRLVIVSIIAALFGGIVYTSGLGAILPILKVLVNGQTLQGWVDQVIVNHGEPTPRYLEVLRTAVGYLPTEPVKAIAAVFGIIFCLGILGNCVRFIQEYFSDKAAISAVNDIRRRLYDHVLHIPMGFFGLKGTSDVTSRLVQDAQGLQDGFKTVLGQSIQEPIKAAMALGLAFVLSWKLTLFIIIFAPVMAIAIRKFGKKMRRASRAALQNSSTMLGQIEGTLMGIRVVKAANAERFERRRYAKIMSGLRREQLKMARYEALSTPTLETLAMLVVGCVLIFASYLVLVEGSIDTTTFFMVMACLVGITEALRKVSKVNNVLQRSNAAAGRIFETLDIPIERHRTSSAGLTPSPSLLDFGELSRAGEGKGEGLLEPRYNLPPIQSEVRFENVTFSYPNSTNPALIDIHLTVPKGRSIAVVGRNGSGKTTLLALLPRFYDPQVGRVTIDGIDVRRATLRSLRRQIAIVTQDPVIFPGTIAENIAYGLPLATRAQIESAAKRAFAHEFILEKPQGYDTSLDGLGSQMSGGQKQRLNIARAILRNAPILILDEATSQVDAESEHLIQHAIETLMHERTTFVIAHRFSTIVSADEIVVLDRGRIVGQGQHDQLLQTCQTYQQLYERQMIAPAG